MKDPVYDACRQELQTFVDSWVKKWHKAPYNPSLFNSETMERLILETLYKVHSEICDDDGV